MKDIDKIHEAIVSIAHLESWLIRLRQKKISFVKGFDGTIPTDINRTTALLRGLTIEQRLNEYKLSILLDQILAKKKNPLTEEIIQKAEFGNHANIRIPSDADITIDVMNYGKRSVYRLGQQEPSPKPEQSVPTAPEQKQNEILNKLLLAIHKDLPLLIDTYGFPRTVVKAIYRIRSERKRVQAKIDRAVLKADRKWARYIIRHYKQATPIVVQLANSNKRRPKTKRQKVIQL